QLLATFSQKHIPLQIHPPQSNPFLVHIQNTALNKLTKNNKPFFLILHPAAIHKPPHPDHITRLISQMSPFQTPFDN
ncbi:alkaline phosphatase, partial [Staphylococcus epidermidis]|uniref:alkaline phosphatase n=1 Tax=Staphylococcus epidermidis TaxID=1282 RepID=UPI001642C156